MKQCTRLAQLGLTASVLAMAFAPTDGLAIANWGRKYKVDCTACHEPAVPRLNALGHQFRKMGYRMDTEVGKDAKPEAYKELGDWFPVRYRAGFSAEHFSDRQAAGGGANSYRNRNGFVRPDVTVFYAGTLSKNLSLFTEVEFADVDETELQVFMQYFQGDSDHYFTARLGQMHTLSRIGWAGFDRPTGITTPDVLSSRKLTTSPVTYRVGEDQRGLDFAYAFTPDSRIIAGIYNGVNQQGAGNEFNGAGYGDNDNAKDALVAYEQMIGESGFTLFGNFGTWDQAAGTSYNAAGNVVPAAGAFLTTMDNKNQTEFNFLRLGATASYVFSLFDPKKVGNSELQAGYMYAKDFYPKGLPFEDRDGHALWAGVQQWLPHSSAVFYRFDRLSRQAEASGGPRLRHTVGAVYTVQQYLRLSGEVFAYDQNSDSVGILFQAMLNC